MKITRRGFLSASAAAVPATALAGCAPQPKPLYPDQSGEPFEGDEPFPSGVVSADPTPTAVLLWTRVNPGLDEGLGVLVTVEVSPNPTFSIDTVVLHAALAEASNDHCVTIDVDSLAASTTYWYRFVAAGHVSRVGRTRTAPALGSTTDRLRIAAFSCQRWTHGYYTAHADMAALATDPSTDLDVVLSLGDYIYETGYADNVLIPGRHDPIQRAITVDDFRSKYRMYRSDPDLQNMHALYPVVSVFDNHDGMSQPSDPQGGAALQAFFEHVPVRATESGRIYRSLQWGALADIYMTDQRQYRDANLKESGLIGTSSEERPEVLDPNRTMLGQPQRDWLFDGLVSSPATWKVIGGQMMFWPWRSIPRFPWQPRGAGTFLNLEQWDGFGGERLALLDRLESAGVANTVMFTGDSHIFSAAQVAPDVDSANSVPRIIEFGTGSITSNNADESGLPGNDMFDYLKAANQHHLRYLEMVRHGYVTAELTPDRMTVQIRSPRTIRAPQSPTDVLAQFEVLTDSQTIRRLP